MNERLIHKLKRKLIGIRPIKLGSFARIAYSGDAGDEEVVRLNPNRVPIHAQTPFSRNEQAGLNKGINISKWGSEIITKENY